MAEGKGQGASFAHRSFSEGEAEGEEHRAQSSGQNKKKVNLINE